MEAKPYSLQAPESVAKEFGGNKQKIAAAVQSGMVDPTAALLAGMFIDRMRSATALEQAPTQTLAQQTFAPPAPPPMPGAGGLGAINPRPAPQLAAAMQPPQQQAAPPPPGMAAGGLAVLPNNAFDEGSFAGGGIVSFADGGSYLDRLREKDFTGRNKEPTKEELRAIEELVRKNKQSYVKGKTTLANLSDALNASYEGPRADAILPNLVGGPREEAPPFSLDAPFQPKNWELEDAMRQKVPVNLPQEIPPPSAGLGAIDPERESARVSAASSTGAPSSSNRNRAGLDVSSSTPVAPDQTLEQILAAREKYMGAGPKFEGTSAEEKAARKNEDLWTMLAQIGFGTAAGTSQHALENIGKGAAGAMPAMQEAMKNRRADAKEERKMEFESLLAQRKEKGEGYDTSLKEFGRLDSKAQEKELAEMREATARRGQDINREVGMAQVNRGSGQERLVDMIVKGMPGGDNAQNRAKAAEYVVGKFSGEDRGAEIANKAEDNLQKRIENDLNLGRKLRQLATADRKNGTNLYEAERNRLLALETQKLRGSALPGPMGSGNSGGSGGWKLLGAE